MSAQVRALHGPKLRHDGMVRISTATNRTAVHWKQEELLWSQLLDRLSRHQRTQETLAEYRAMPKAQQDAVKDTGGFVGGTLKGGRRKATHVQARWLITLDADTADPGLWDTVELLFDFAACVYSTHSHSPERPRLRLVIPVRRPLTREEYQPVARLVAADLGIEQFDPTTFEAHRLMYWPSGPRDVEPVFAWQDGPWLDPDELLARYEDWRDPASWPTPMKEVRQRDRAAEKAEDPTTKRGIVGAFCRTYDIETAIETFLPGVYVPAGEGRYTYAAGSTVGGLVIYDGGLFAYSHHGTDPCSGRLVNAWDLVRLHRFGELDDEVEDGTRGNRLPSHLAMQELAQEDPAVRETAAKDRAAEIAEDFGEPVATTEAEEPVDPQWRQKLKLNSKGAIQATRDNILMILENDPWLRGKIALNEFTGRATLRDAVPWDKQTHDRAWSDADDAGLRHYLERGYGIDNITKTHDALQLVMGRRKYHPVRDYLNGLEWDGLDRVDTLLVEYLGAEDSPYVRAVTRKALVAAVARVFQPGCKWDYVLTLVGPQGVGKSQLVDRLAGEWFSDSLPDLGKGKDAYEALQGVWIIELGELSATRRADLETIKHFLSKRTDRFRVAYGRHVQEFPRQMVIWATTNNLTFLRDATGNRRWWPVVVPGKADRPVTRLDKAEVDQIWAEALHYYKQGERLYLDGDLERVATEIQEYHTEESERAGQVRQYLDTPLPSDWEERGLAERRAYLHGGDFGEEERGHIVRQRVCVMEIWCELFGGRPENLTVATSRELHEILRTIPGWKYVGRRRFSAIYGTQRAYERVDSA